MIASMERIWIVGSQSVLDNCIRLVQQSGCIHVVKSQKDRFLSRSGLETGMFQKEVSEKLQKAESMLLEVKTSLTIVAKIHHTEGKTIPAPLDKKVRFLEKNYKEIESITKQIKDFENTIRLLTDELNEIRLYRSTFEEFQPLIHQMESLHGIEIYGIFFRGKENETKANIKILEKSLSKVTNEAYSLFTGDLKGHGIPCLVVYPISMRDVVEKKVFGQYHGKIDPMHIPQRFEQRTYASTLSYLFKREKEAEHELYLTQEKLQTRAAGWTTKLKRANQWLSYAVDRLQVRNYIAMSKKTFWISGWIPSDRVPELRVRLEKEFKGEVFMYTTIPSADEFGEAPVLLKNPTWVKPFERLLSFFPLPLYGTVDPTWLMMIFFPLFFGLMLGDVGYALIMGVIAWLIRSRKATNKLWKDINIIITTCAVSTGLFGMFYGEFFGKIWYSMGLPHPLFDRKVEIIPLLVGVLFLGGLHLSIGNIVGIRLSLAKGNVREGANYFSNIILISSIVWIFGMTILGLSVKTALFILIAGFIIKILSCKIADLFEVIKLFSNVLSYARLMALGTASVILADLADDIFLNSDGVLLALIAAIGIHSLNFILGVFSPTIQSIRLHYVEFFNQFYQPGGIKFNPLKEHLIS